MVDGVAGEFRNVAQTDHGGVVGHQSEGHAVALGTAGTADTVDVVLIFIGYIVVDHRIHVVHVNATGGHIGGYKDPQLAPAEPGHHLFPFLLGDVTVDAHGVHTPHLQKVADPLGVALGVAEDHHPVIAAEVQDLLHCVNFFVHGYVQPVLKNIGLVLLAGLDGDLLGVPLVDPGNVHHLPGDGGGEEAQVFPALHLVEKTGHVVDETHIQHPVGLVQHHSLHLVQADRAALEVVAEAAGGGDDDLGLFLQGFNLLANGLAAVEADHPQPLFELGDLPHLRGDLEGQLPGGGQDHRLYGVAVGVDVLYNGDAEGKCLAGAGGGLGGEILPRHHGGDTSCLDGGGNLIALFFQCTHDLRGEPQGIKAHALRYFHGQNSSLSILLRDVRLFERFPGLPAQMPALRFHFRCLYRLRNWKNCP